MKEASVTTQLHIFTDASDRVFSAVAYLRTIHQDFVEVSILASKVQVKSKKKTVSIPRMELQGAVLGIHLQNLILLNLPFVDNKDVYFWTDSQVILWWINSKSLNLNPFVQHRIEKIKKSSNIRSWRYIPSHLNVADDATKRKRKLEVSNSSRWLKGPDFLKEDSQLWPRHSLCKSIPEEGIEECKHFVATLNLVNKCALENIIDFRKYSSFRKIKRVIAWVLKAKNSFLHRKRYDKLSLTLEELQSAEKFLIKEIQDTFYSQELECLRSKHNVDKSSSLRKLYPFLDEDGILRVGGRLENAWFLSFHSRHPAILPKNNTVTLLIIKQYHEDYLHQNLNVVLNEIRLKFWIPSLKQQLRKITSSCQFCKIKHAQPQQPRMSSLPVDRITPFQRPFTSCGMDYCGPFSVKILNKEQKIWILLFTCMSTRAIHLETSYDLTSSSCLIALSNFINRRGVPSRVRSDNASYFKCSKKRLAQIITEEDIQSVTNRFGFEWVFNTPDSPHMGGVWERLIQCVKKVLEVSLNVRVLNHNIFQSLVIQAENIVNSRPLTDVPIENEFSECLTPNHFLLGEPNSLQTFLEKRIELKLPKQFRIMKQVKNRLWSKWIKQYLPELTKLPKWYEESKPIALGDLVLICSDKDNYTRWERGRVIKLFPGKDSIIRTVDIKTSRGVLKRAVNKLAILDVGLENV